MRVNHPKIHSELSKLVSIVEDIIPLAIFKSKTATDEKRCAVIYEFTVAAGPRVMFLSSAEPLSEQEWKLGCLYFLLKTLAIFEEFSPALQSELYPSDETSTGISLLRMLVDCMDGLGWGHFLYPGSEEADMDCDPLSLDIVVDLCTFTCTLSTSQFRRLQLDMTELAIGRSELWNVLAREWWISIAERLGPEFSQDRIKVLMELVLSHP
jgi:hypothetical protein